MQVALLAISTLIAFACMVLFAISAAGADNEADSLYNMPWLVTTRNDDSYAYDAIFYWGLTAFLTDYTSCNLPSILCGSQSDFVTNYDDCDDADVCSDCKDAGMDTLVLVCIAFAFSGLVLLVSFVRLCIDSVVGMVLGTTFCALATIFGVCAIAVFGSCTNSIVDEEVVGGNNAYYSVGAATCILALLLSFINMVLNLASIDYKVVERTTAVQRSTPVPHEEFTVITEERVVA